MEKFAVTEFLSLVAIIAILIICVIAATTAIVKVSAFYRQRFGFSLWSGVLLFVVAVSILLIAETAPIKVQTQYVLMGILAILVILTGLNDVRLAGYAWGALAFCLQIVLSLCFVILILVALVGLVLRRVFKIQSSLFNSILGTNSSLKAEFLLLVYFLHL